MSIFIKPLIEISFSDINYLVQNKIRESYDLDYKSDYPNSKKIDVFSREKREGFSQWGNQVDFFNCG